MPTYKYLYRLILLSVAWLMCLPCFAQSSPGSMQKWDNLLRRYNDGNLSQTNYLNAVDSLALTDIENLQLKDRLAPYREIVWEHDKERKRRAKYYYYLICNAKVNGQSGKVFYYVEKYAKEQNASGKGYPVDVAHVGNIEKLELFITAGDFANADTIFEKELKYYEKKPGEIANRGLKSDPQSDMFVLCQMSSVYSGLKDSVKLFQVIKLATAIYGKVVKQDSLSSWDKQMCFSLLQSSKCFGYLFQSKFDAAERELKQIIAIQKLPVEPGQSRRAILQEQLLQNFTAQLLDFYIARGNVDSAKKYQLLAEDLAGVEYVEDDIGLLKSRSEIQALGGNYQQAFQTLQKILGKTDTLLKRKTLEISENMYAQALAEDKKEEAERLNTERRKLILATAFGTLLLLTAIGLLVRRSYTREKQAKRNVDELKRSTELQIAELEERGNVLQKIERQRLGLELHNGLANQLAYLKLLTGTVAADCNEPETVRQLGKIMDLTGDAYEAARNKSHDWYQISQVEQNASFSEKIHAIVDNALPERLFEKEIDIDDHNLGRLPLPSKIELLYIIRESLTNILKHVKSGKVVLLIYEETGNLIYSVQDNGKGFEANSKKGIGLASILEHARKMQGSAEFVSGKTGTELLVMMPLPEWSLG